MTVCLQPRTGVSPDLRTEFAGLGYPKGTISPPRIEPETVHRPRAPRFVQLAPHRVCDQRGVRIRPLSPRTAKVLTPTRTRSSSRVSPLGCRRADAVHHDMTPSAPRHHASTVRFTQAHGKPIIYIMLSKTLHIASDESRLDRRTSYGHSLNDAVHQGFPPRHASFEEHTQRPRGHRRAPRATR